jgi:hypothetical protein
MRIRHARRRQTNAAVQRTLHSAHACCFTRRGVITILIRRIIAGISLIRKRRLDEDLNAELWESVLDSAGQDLRYALRSLRKSPGFTSAAVLTLALGIGATTAIFGLLDAVVFKSLPVEKPEERAHVRPSGLQYLTE